MNNLPSLYELLASEKSAYDRRRKSARAFYKFYGTRAVKPINDKNSDGRPAGDYFWIDGAEYMATGYDLVNYAVFLIPLKPGRQIIKNF